MTLTVRRWLFAIGFVTITLLVALLARATTGSRTPAPDPLAAALERWTALLRDDARTDPLWLDARKGTEAALAQARDELRQGRRWLALERLAAVEQNLGAALYAVERPAPERKDLAAFEAEWARVGAALGPLVSPGGEAGESAAALRPAVVRALAELSIAQAREFYAASLEYGRNTEPQFGLYYLGAARAQRRILDLARALPPPPAAAAPPLRPIAPEIDALQGELLAAYRPPASIDRHADFIAASATLKEARAHDAAGRRHAALLRYLQAAQRVALLRGSSAEAGEVAGRLEAAADRLRGADHSIGQFFLERAHSARAGHGPPEAAAVVAADVLPRYFRALEPAPPAPAPPTPTVTVTLVRWPFT